MIETYKLLSGKYDSQVALKLPPYSMLGIIKRNFNHSVAR